MECTEKLETKKNYRINPRGVKEITLWQKKIII
jgi:DNA-binding PadR family transcriptional regulator